jgi:hypothetical protein
VELNVLWCVFASTEDSDDDDVPLGQLLKKKEPKLPAG